ncbi:Fanconi anemia group D2 protein [Quaeritorhiza haematococci]|nr:Fanconi anemia group D2 protein [Quaeritorhiza haematococci]
MLRSSNAIDKGKGRVAPVNEQFQSDDGSNDAPVKDTVFHRLTFECGLRIDERGTTNELVVDQAIFRRRLINKLKRASAATNMRMDSGRSIVDGFLEDFAEHISDNEGCLVVQFSNRFSDSLIKILLCTDELQPALIDMLLEKLPEFMNEESNAFANMNENIPRLIMNQFRWMDYIVNPAQLTAKLIEAIQIAPTHIQMEIITTIPEIVDDSQHKVVVAELKDLMENSAELTIPILDSLSNLNLSTDSLETLQETVISKLDSAELDAVPVILRFLLQSCTNDTAIDVVLAIRENLDFRSISTILMQSNSSQQTPSQEQRTGGLVGMSGKGKGKKPQMSEAVILESLKSGIRFHKFMLDAWLKVVSEIAAATNHHIIDVIVLFIIHSLNPAMKKKVESVFKRKVKDGLFADKLISETVEMHYEGLREYFPDILSLAESLLRAGQGIHGRIASTIYRKAFKVCDNYYRQEIIGSLVTHIGKMDIALGILLQMVEEDAQSVSRFSIFIKNILDYLDNLRMDQIRVLFNVFSVLAIETAPAGSLQGESTAALTTTATESSLLSELYIVIRKQLSNPLERYKRMGVVGALAMVRRLGAQATAGVDESDPLSQNLLHDEVVNWIASNVVESFQDVFLTDPDEEFKELSAKAGGDEDDVDGERDVGTGAGTGMLPLELWMRLTEEVSIAIKVYPTVMQSVPSPFSRLVPNGNKENGGNNDMSSAPLLIIVLCPMFKLFQTIERVKNHGSAEDIDALLPAPIIMYKDMDATHLRSGLGPNMRESLCSSLFYAINWMREIVNAYSTQTDHLEMLGQCLLRIRDILKLERKLTELLSSVPRWCPTGLASSGKRSGVGSAAVCSKEDQDAGMAGAAAGTNGNQTEGEGDGEAPSPKKSDSRTARRSAISKKIIRDSDDDGGKKKRGRKKGGTGSEKGNGKAGSSSTGGKKKGSGSGSGAGAELTGFSSIADLRPYMREFEMDVFQLLKIDEIEAALVDTNQQEKTSEVERVQYPELRYLLEDLLRKIECKFAPPVVIPWFARRSVGGASSASSSAAGSSSMAAGGDVMGSIAGNAGSADDFLSGSAIGVSLLKRTPHLRVMEKICEIVPELCKALEKIGGEIDTLVEEDDDEAVIDMEEHGDMIACFELVIQCIYQLLQWPELRSSDYKIVLAGLLNQFASRTKLNKDLAEDPDVQVLATEAYAYFENFTKNLTTAAHAVLMLKLLEVTAGLAPEPAELYEKVGELADKFMKREWNDCRNLKSESLIYLISRQISRSANPMVRIDKYANVVFQALLESDSDILIQHPLLNRETFPNFFKTTFEQLNVVASQFRVESRDADVELVAIQQMVSAFSKMVDTVKSFDKRQMLSLVLKQGKSFVESFQKRMLPSLGKVFRKHTNDVVGVLKILQSGTRLLQSICGHSKVTKDTVLVANVPLVRRSLETLLFKVKMMLQENDALKAFWLGNLKHRDLDGNEVSSQIPIEKDESDKSSEEEMLSLPEIDPSDEEEEEEEPPKQKKKPAKRRRSSSSTASRRSRKDENSDEDDNDEEEEEEEKQPTRRKQTSKRRRSDSSTAKRSLVSDENDDEGDEDDKPQKKGKPGNKKASGGRSKKPTKRRIIQSSEDEEDAEEEDVDNEETFSKKSKLSLKSGRSSSSSRGAPKKQAGKSKKGKEDESDEEEMPPPKSAEFIESSADEEEEDEDGQDDRVMRGDTAEEEEEEDPNDEMDEMDD